jgi:hypothetical protein
MQVLTNRYTKSMLLYLHDGSYMFRQNNAILREQLDSFLSYFNVSMVAGKLWNVRYKPMCQHVMQRTVHTASWVPARIQLAACTW